MAELKDFGVPGTGIGILHPTMKHRFRFVINGSEKYKLITAQTVRVVADMVKRTITVHVQQPMAYAQDLLDMFEELAKHQFSFSIDMLDGCEGVIGQIVGFADMTSHELEFDYGESAVATHVLTLKYIRTI